MGGFATHFLFIVVMNKDFKEFFIYNFVLIVEAAVLLFWFIGIALTPGGFDFPYID